MKFVLILYVIGIYPPIWRLKMICRYFVVCMYYIPIVNFNNQLILDFNEYQTTTYYLGNQK